MVVNVSLVLLLGLVLFFLLRTRALTLGSALIAAGFGFFLASTGAAGPINDFTTALINAVPTL
ncbi:hypothetical protein ACFVW2_27285 [Streptomyces sp. NPDC058171]